MLCSRSASLTSRTRMSSDMASRNLRRFSAARWLSLCASILESLVTPSTRRATFLPNSFLISAGRRERVLDRVVEDGGDDRLVVELQVGEDAGDLDRVAVIGVARGAGLAAVRLHREDVGAVDQRLVGVGVVAPDLLDQFILPAAPAPKWGAAPAGATENVGRQRARRCSSAVPRRRRRGRRREAAAARRPGGRAPRRRSRGGSRCGWWRRSRLSAQRQIDVAGDEALLRRAAHRSRPGSRRRKRARRGKRAREWRSAA